MISGCFGLLQAFAAKYPAHAEEIRHALEGNYCRCTGYQNIVAAIQSAATTLQKKGAA